VPVPTREQAAATLEDGHALLHALFAQLSPAQMIRPATIGGGEWSAKDLLGHVAFWEELAAQALAEWRAGQRPTIESVVGPQATDAANARNQELTARQSLAAVYERAEAAQRTIQGRSRRCPTRSGTPARFTRKRTARRSRTSWATCSPHPQVRSSTPSPTWTTSKPMSPHYMT
jgi:hypothetical protein